MAQLSAQHMALLVVSLAIFDLLNNTLIRNVMKDEIKFALQSMDSYKLLSHSSLNTFGTSLSKRLFKPYTISLKLPVFLYIAK